MPNAFAEHAEVGDFRLNTKLVDGLWQWTMENVKTNFRPHGISLSSEGAKALAEKAAGHRPKKWYRTLSDSHLGSGAWV
jgi:hypothetical protein